MGKQSPSPGNYEGKAREQANLGNQQLQQQTQANRPTQNTPWAQMGWTQGPDGQWTQNVNLAGGLGQANTALQQQLAQLSANPLDLGGLPQLDYGQDAGQRAYQNAYEQASGRLTPQFQQQEQALQARLANQGLNPGSEAARRAMREFNTARNDAFQGARQAAFGQGLQAQQQAFGQSMGARQLALAEALKKRGLPYEELAALRGFTTMPSFMGAGRGEAPELLGAARAQFGDDVTKYGLDQRAMADMFQAIGGLGPLIGGLYSLSDRRAKRNIHRLPAEVMPGVPLATWEYRHQPGRRHVGVIAQDVLAVMPEAVVVGDDGLYRVNYSLLARRANSSILSILSGAAAPLETV